MKSDSTNLKKTTENLNNQIIDVIENSDYSTQNPKDVEKLKAWRKNKSNPYAYNYKKDSREVTYIHGHGFINTMSEDAEATIIKNIAELLGASLLSFFFVQNVFNKFIVIIMELIGFNIHQSLSTATLYGGKFEIMFVITLTCILKFLIPIIIIYFKLKMPFKISLPTTLHSSNELFLAISLSMAVSVIANIPSVYMSETKEIFVFFNMDEEIFSLDQKELLIYIIVDIIIVSILKEILFNGAALQALRQFGDFFAILVMSILSTICSENLKAFYIELIVSIAASYCVVRCNTLLSGIIIRVINKIILYSFIIVDLKADNPEISRTFIMLSVFAVSIIILAFIRKKIFQRGILKTNFKTFISTKNKIKLFFTNPSMASVTIIVVLLTLTTLLI